MVASCFLLGIVRTFQGFIYDTYFSNILYNATPDPSIGMLAD